MNRAPLAIDYLSPLPPVRSGISEYSVDLLPALEEQLGGQLRVIALAGQPVSDEVARRWHPAPMATTGSDGRLPLYHMGNNEHHLPVWETACRLPGVVVLHDLVLHHFLVERTLARLDLTGYLDALELEHGWAGLAAGRTRKWNAYSEAAHFAFPTNRALVRGARGVLVHSEWATRRLADENPGLRVQAIPMGVPAPPPLDAEIGEAFRRRHAIPLRVPLLGSFGFQTPIKRTTAVIRALADPRLGAAHLVVAGEEAHILDLGRTAAEAGVSDRVHRLGYVSFAELEAAMAASDLSVNLRYPTAGETSASLLRLLAVGRPVLVSDFAQFAELPGEVAIKAPLTFDHEATALAAALAELLDNRPRLLAMGEAARRYVLDHHQPRQAAAALVDACQAWRDCAPLGGDPTPPSPPTTRTWGRIDGELELEGAQGWAPGTRTELVVTLHNRGLARWLAAERGQGGVVLEVRLEELVEGQVGGPGGGLQPKDILANQQWRGLPRDLPGGTHIRLPLVLRRPPGPARLVIEPHVLGVAGFAALGGPRLELDLGRGELESATFQ